MDLGASQDWAQGAGAFKNVVEGIRTVLDFSGRSDQEGGSRRQRSRHRSTVPSLKLPRPQELRMLKLPKLSATHSVTASFLPVAMLTVGYGDGRKSGNGPVHECPQCGHITSGPIPSSGRRLRGRNRTPESSGRGRPAR